MQVTKRPFEIVEKNQVKHGPSIWNVALPHHTERNMKEVTKNLFEIMENGLSTVNQDKQGLSGWNVGLPTAPECKSPRTYLRLLYHKLR